MYTVIEYIQNRAYFYQGPNTYYMDLSKWEEPTATTFVIENEVNLNFLISLGPGQLKGCIQVLTDDDINFGFNK